MYYNLLLFSDIGQNNVSSNACSIFPRIFSDEVVSSTNLFLQLVDRSIKQTSSRRFLFALFDNTSCLSPSTITLCLSVDHNTAYCTMKLSSTDPPPPNRSFILSKNQSSDLRQTLMHSTSYSEIPFYSKQFSSVRSDDADGVY